MAADTFCSLPPASPVWTRRFMWLVAGALVFRVVYLFTAINFQLSGDEAYYWDWGRRLDWCYYSKPPMIGWLMGLVGRLSGDKWWAVRLTATLLGTVSLSLLFLLGKQLYNSRTGFFATLLLLLTPANLIANFGLTIDAPLLLCWTAALIVFWKAIGNPRSASAWLALTLIVGIGTLAKQMMLAFPGAMLLFALLNPDHRSLVRRPAFWLCILGSLAFLTPMLWWNAQHHGVTLDHMKEHFHHKKLGFFGSVGQFLTFPGLQAGMFSPITWGVLIAAMVIGVRSWRSLDLRQRFLISFSAPALVVFLILALRQNVGPNWPAVFYLPLFVLAPAMAVDCPRLNVWMVRGIKLGATCVAVAYLYLPLIGPLGLTGRKGFDPVESMRGWQEAALGVQKFWPEMLHPEKTFVVVLDHRRFASQMAFNMPSHPFVYRWNEDGKIESQYEIWPSFADKIGWDCFLIYPDSDDDNYQKKPLAPSIRHAFDKYHKLGDVNVDIGHGVRRSFQIFQLKRLQHYPVAEPVEDPNNPPPETKK